DGAARRDRQCRSLALFGRVRLCHWQCNGRRRRPNDSVAAQSGLERTHEKRVATMEIKRAGSQPSTMGPSDWFTGTVRIDPLFQAPDPAFVQGASVTFEPGARTAWHTHPLGQTLIVTAGSAGFSGKAARSRRSVLVT